MREAKIYPGKEQKTKKGWKNVESSCWAARKFFLSISKFLKIFDVEKSLPNFQTVYVLCVSWLFKDSNFGSPITWWRDNAKGRPVIGRLKCCRRCRLLSSCRWWCSKGSKIFVGRTYSSLFLRFRFNFFSSSSLSGLLNFLVEMDTAVESLNLRFHRTGRLLLPSRFKHFLFILFQDRQSFILRFCQNVFQRWKCYFTCRVRMIDSQRFRGKPNPAIRLKLQSQTSRPF